MSAFLQREAKAKCKAVQVLFYLKPPSWACLIRNSIPKEYGMCREHFTIGCCYHLQLWGFHVNLPLCLSLSPLRKKIRANGVDVCQLCVGRACCLLVIPLSLKTEHLSQHTMAANMPVMNVINPALPNVLAGAIAASLLVSFAIPANGHELRGHVYPFSIAYLVMNL